MNVTKRRILDASLNLYNSQGLSAVSQRKITTYLQISPGNLTYHFNKKEDIDTALYFELVACMDSIHEKLITEALSLATLGNFTEYLFDLIFEYRFIFLDFVHLMKSNQKVATHYKELLKFRKLQFIQIIEMLKMQGVFREEALPDEYEKLYGRIQVYSDFYLSSVEIIEGGVAEIHKTHYKTNIQYAIYPYLTEKGRTEFANM